MRVGLQGGRAAPSAQGQAQNGNHALSGRSAPQRLPCPSPAQRVVAKAAKLEDSDTVSSNGAASSTNPLDFDELTDIIRMVHDTDIVELELKSKKFSLAVRKKEALKQPEPLYQMPPPQYGMPPPAQAAAPPAPAPSSSSTMPSAPSPAPAAPSEKPKAEGVEVSSPMSGTFYRSPAPGEPPFVNMGDRVEKGQTIGIIEAMKLMNEIEAEVSGEIVGFLAENGSPVTPGVGLFLIKPS